MDEVRRYDDLIQHPGYRFLVERVEDQRDAYTAKIARRLMAGEEVSQREIDWYRGYYAGALETLRRPYVAEHNLEGAARLAWGLASEAITEKENETPYV